MASLFPPPPVVILPPSDHLGDVWANNRYEHQVELENRSDGDVQITGVSDGCRSVGMSEIPFRLGKGDRRTLALTLDLGLDGKAESRPVVLRAVVKRAGADRVEVVQWPLAGRSHRLIETPDLWQLGRRGERDTRWVARAVVSVAMPVASLAVRLDPVLYSCTVERAAADQFVVSVRPTGEFPPARFERDAVLTVTDPDGNELPSRTIATRLEVVAECRAEPAELLLPATQVGRTAGGSFVVGTESGSALMVQSVSVSVPAVTATHEGNGVIRVTCRPDHVGCLAATVGVEVATPSGRRTITVPVSVTSVRGD